MRRPPACALFAAVTPLALAACSASAAMTPASTRGVATTATETSDAPLAPPSSLTPPRVHATEAIAAFLDGYDVAGLTRARSGAVADVSACPGTPRLTRPSGPDAYARSWLGRSGVRADVAAITYPDLAAAAAAVEPVLDAAASCTSPGPAGGVTTRVENERRDVAEGMPLGRVDLTRTSADGTLHDYIGVVQVGNVVVRLTYSSPDAKRANEKGSTTLARLARDVQGL
jgi:hypothetical protein